MRLKGKVAIVTGAASGFGRGIAGISLGRMSTPADIANAALFFANPASAFITVV
jgi:NAD(P)-dependent dehydrogenase (short-subunit alcohol dehydrogenase family)